MLTGARPGRDRQDHRRARRAGHRATSSRTAAPRSASQGARSPQARDRARRAGPARQGPARLRAVRQAEARHHRLPAAGQLPARARGRDRPHDRPGRRRLAAPRSSSCSPRTSSSPRTQTPATAAVLLSGDGAASTRAPCAASPSSSPRAVEGLKPTTSRSPTARRAAVAERRRRGRRHRRRASKLAAEQRYNAQLEAQPRRAARPTLGPDKAHVQVHADLNVDKATSDKLTYGKKGIAAQADRGDRAPRGRAARRRRRAGHARATSRPTPAARRGGGDSNYERKSTADRLRRRQDRPAHEGRARARSTA